MASSDVFRSKIGSKYPKQEIEDRQLQLKAELTSLKRKGGNTQCFDCGVADVTWASPKLGTFLCVTCSDIHRAAGAHITCVKNFSTYLWSPDEVAMMRLVGNDRAKDLYRSSAPLSWSPHDSKERKVQLCTQLYGNATAQRASAEMITAATAASASPAPNPSQGFKAPAGKSPAGAPNWFEDWSSPRDEDPKVAQKSVDLLGDLLDLQPVLQKAGAVEADVFLQQGYVDVVKAPAVEKFHNELAGVFDNKCQQTVAQPARCAMQMANKEDNDFWTSVNWDDLMK
ncbi:putative ADP-ribosylation factor GTPase-activating protein AGD9 [Symbiodinium microadriaticum]|uniref:Putative ADP-ribosylation factor GTPase-activating protein AGD9 n=1 Tax=Symbiodinium microadriaticum TaxID=2951 RepID=A0A1Q9E896_SYMMI|nr:putative ADP-ribosylation factor GTPase-activating protein AGD9 [Symbiodinium microadriaticum]